MTDDADFVIKRNDTRPYCRATLKDANGDAINGNAATVRFHMREPGATLLKVNAPAVWVDQLGGVAEYQWLPADTDTADVYEVEFEVTFGDGTVQTFPNEGFKSLRVARDLA